MAEPAKKWEDHDRIPGNADSAPLGKPALQKLEGGGETTPRKKGHLSQVPDRENLSDQEQAGSGKGKQLESTPSEYENRVGRGYVGASKLGGVRNFFSGWSGRRKALFGFGAGAGIGAIIIGAFLAMLPLELIHIKNVFYKEIGGVQSRTYQLGRERYYSRMFFFDKEGNFSGYKNTGIRGMMYQNRQTKKMVEALEKNGYRIDFEKINDNETGRVKALHRIDRKGNIIPGQSITNNGDLTRAWDIKRSGVLPDILSTIYPDESARWHGKQAKKLYKRWGLTRTNWVGEYLREKGGINALERKELALRGALRQHLFGGGDTKIEPNITPVNEKDADSADKDLKDTAHTAIANNGMADSVTENAKTLEQNLSDNLDQEPEEPTMRSLARGALSGLSVEAIAKGAAKNVPGNMVKSLSALSLVQNACVGKGALDSVVVGARVLRASQLMRFGMSVLNIADATQNGKAVSSEDVDVLMTYLNSKDRNGKTMFNSSGWRYWTNPGTKDNFKFSNYDQEERNKYSVGGGFTGTLASIDHTLNEKIKLEGGCKVANNFFVQIGSLVVGVAAGILSGGTFTAVNLAANVGLTAVTDIAVSVATEMLTPMVAGAVVHGGEAGTAVGNALVSGLEVLSNANGANAGLRPLTTEEYKIALDDTKAYQNAQLAQMGIIERLFSPENNQSLTMAAFTGMQNFKISSFFSNPFASLGNIFNGFLSPRAHAANNTNSGCTDPDITKYNIAATPFCTVQVGIPRSMIDNPEYYPDVVDQKMIDGGYVDENGNPIEGKGYDSYLMQCTSEDENGGGSGRDFRAIDIIHNSSNDYTGKCSENPLFYMYRFYSYIGQTENDGLTGNNISDFDTTSSSSGNASTGSGSAPLSGSAQEIAKKILEAQASDKVKFNVIYERDRLYSSTPEGNIRSISLGQLAKTTPDCTGRKGVKAPNANTNINANLLKFILELSQTQNIQINALAGQCHSANSSHYRGEAVDFGCPFDSTAGDRIGSKYGVTRYAEESCSNSAEHFHYSIGGN